MINFSVENLVVIIAGFFALIIPIYLLINNFKSRINQVYAATLIFSGPLWAISIALFREAKDMNTAYTWDRLIYIVATFIGLMYHWFSYVFPRSRKFEIKSSFFIILSGIGLIYSILFSDLFIKDIILNDNGNKAILGPIYVAWMIWIILVFVIGARQITRDYSNLNDVEKNQLKYLTFGILLPTFGVIPTNALLPLIGIYEYIWIGPLFMILLNLIVAYGISRTRFASSGVILTNLLKIIIGGVLMMLFYLTLRNFDTFLTESTDTAARIGILLIIAVILSLPLIWLIKSLDKFLFKIVTRSKYLNTDLRDEFSKQLSPQLDINKISTIIISQLSNLFAIESLSLVILNSNLDKIIFSQSKNFTIPSTTDFFDIYANAQTLFSSQEPLVLSEIEYSLVNQIGDPTIKESTRLEHLIKIMNKHQIGLVYEMQLKSNNHGFLLIGARPDKNVYTTQEINLIKSLIHTFSVGISRAFLYSEVQSFNIQLKSEINKATQELQERNLELKKNERKLNVAYKQLQTLDDAKSDFISIASHQLRTPLSIIKGYLSMLEESDYGKVNTEQKRIINMSINSLNDLNSIVNEILTSSRIEKGSFAIVKVEADIIDMVKYVYNLYKNKYEIKGLDFKLVLPKNIKKLPAMLDKDKFEQVVINLIENAFNYTPKGGVTVTLENDKSSFTYSVQDTGIGIPKDSQDKLFERFTRLENAQKIRPDGTGIGLYTAKVIVEKHGGKIWFKSIEGKGTTFFVKVPLK